MRFRTNNIRFEGWRIDPDGNLRVTARALKAGVFNYKADEYPAEVLSEFGGAEEIDEFIPPEEFTPDFLRSYEGKPIIVNAHEWQTPDKAEQMQSVEVGSVAGTPRVENDDIICDYIIRDARAIEAIKGKKIVQNSAGYDSDLEKADGEYKGQRYQAIQRNLRLNHILLIEEGSGRKGKCGPDVRILNADNDISKENTMKVKIYNAEGKQVEIEFTGDAAQVKPVTDLLQGYNEELTRVRKLNDEKTEEAKKKGEEVEKLKKENDETKRSKEDLEARVKTLNDDITGHIAKLTESQKALDEAKKALDEFSSEETMEKETELRKEQANDEQAVVAAEIKPPEREALKTEMKNCYDVHKKNCTETKAKPMPVHKFNSEFLTKKIMKGRNVDLANAKPEEIAAAWTVLKTTARAQQMNSLPAVPQFNSTTAGATSKHPAMQPAEHA